MKRKSFLLVFAGFVPFFLPASNNVLQLVLLKPNRSAILEENPAVLTRAELVFLPDCKNFRETAGC